MLRECMAAVKSKNVPLNIITLQIAFVVTFAVFARYDRSLVGSSSRSPHNNTAPAMPHRVISSAKFQDVNVMIFVGFGFLMAFVRRYGFSSVGYNLLITAFIVEMAAVMDGVGFMIFFGHSSFSMNLASLFANMLAAMTAIVSWGAVLGKVSVFQLLVMAMVEINFTSLNQFLFQFFQVPDVGGSLRVHAFGAYFGLAVSRVLHNEDIKSSRKRRSVYQSDIVSLIGTVFLWVYWPSFNAGYVGLEFESITVVNTYISLIACTVTTFGVSSLVDKSAKFDLVHIQHATLAGGVAVGMCSNLLIEPYGAIMIGTFAGFLSVLGSKYITPFLEEHRVHDTCGVHNRHGLPALLAAVAGIIATATATEDVYGASLYSAFAARAPPANSTKLLELRSRYRAEIIPGVGRSAVVQCGYLTLVMICTVALAIISGVITGFIMKLRMTKPLDAGDMFDDGASWRLPDISVESPTARDPETGTASRPGTPDAATVLM